MQDIYKGKYLTNEISKSDLIIFSVYRLGGESKFVDTEDVAKTVDEIAPGQFIWRKYPDQINLELVRVILANAKKQQNGQLLEGSGKRGWTLTLNGLDWINKNKKKVTAAVKSGVRITAKRSGSVDSQRIDREKSRILSMDAWTQWVDASIPPSVSDAKAIFRIDSYSRGTMLALKINRLLKIFSSDADLRDFLEVSAEQIRNEVAQDGS
ncbi:hypothetical protein ACFL00_03100 [Pseudomonadota bacterium]